MRKVLLYSALLAIGLVGSQCLPPSEILKWSISTLTMVVLSFIMIRVGYEFEIDKTRPRQYAWDSVVASTAASIPWILCCLYFVFILAPPELWHHADLWRASAFGALFSAATSAGVLFAMLAAAGLAASWVFQKARVLAIFDDLGTIMLLAGVKIALVGMKWQLIVVLGLIGVLMWVAWRYLHTIRLPVSWPLVLLYAAGIAACSEAIYSLSKLIDPDSPIHFEVLLPAFVLGCVMAHPQQKDSPTRVARSEELASDVLSGCFMVLVGLSMPTVFAKASEGTGVHPVLAFEGVSDDAMAAMHAMPGPLMLVIHVLVVTFLSNLGKLFPAACYRKEATLRERFALGIAMFPRGEVGGGVLVLSIGYGMGGPALTVAVLVLALNLLCTGLYIVAVKRLLVRTAATE